MAAESSVGASRVEVVDRFGLRPLFSCEVVAWIL